MTAVRRGPMTWLVLACQLPPRSPLTATIRRRLAAAGAVYPANAVAVLPASAAGDRAFRCLLNSIREAGGSAQVLRAEAIEGERDLAAAFNAAREREYDQIVAGCGDIAAGIQEHTAAGHFRVAVSNR